MGLILLSAKMIGTLENLTLSASLEEKEINLFEGHYYATR